MIPGFLITLLVFQHSGSAPGSCLLLFVPRPWERASETASDTTTVSRDPGHLPRLLALSANHTLPTACLVYASASPGCEIISVVFSSGPKGRCALTLVARLGRSLKPASDVLAVAA
jgi:hypothetical protein